VVRRVVALGLAVVVWALAPVGQVRAETNWLEVGEPELPPNLLEAGLAYDEARQRVVLFGGRNRWTGVSNTQVWESDGSRWVRRDFPDTPSLQSNTTAMAYDAARGRMVVWTGETWQLDGLRWSGPSVGVDATTLMAYDSVRGRVVAASGGSILEFDGEHWTTKLPRTPVALPTVGAVAFDGDRDRLVAFTSGPQTWEWNGTDWARRQPSNSPPESYSGMAYDSVRRKTVLVTKEGETWEWDGADWSRRMSLPALSISNNVSRRMAFDTKKARVLLFSPRHVDTDAGDLWEWDGTAWSARSQTSTPSPRWNHLMAFDSLRQRLMLFGGGQPKNVSFLEDTWEFDGTAWDLQNPATSPGPIVIGAAAYSPTSAAVLLVGGFRAGRGNDDVWSWNGTAWAKRTPETTRWCSKQAVAFDTDRGVLVEFGGDAGTGEAWEWNGHALVEVPAPLNPPNRLVPALAFDRLRHRSVLFGGEGKNDTWEWSGTDWFAYEPHARPSALQWHAMAYDEQRQQVVLFGGEAGGVAVNDTWMWEPEAPTPTWRYVNASSSPPRSKAHAMAYDSTGHRLLVFGGAADYYGPYHGDLWELPSGLAARAGLDRVVVTGVPTRLSGAGSGSETSTLAYSWAVTGGDSSKVVLAGAASGAPSITATAPGTYVITLSVSESGLTTADSLTLTVHTSPVAEITGNDRSVVYGTPPTLDVLASDDDSDPLSYRWYVAKGPGGAFFTSQTGAATLLQPAVPGTYLLGCSVTDGRGGCAAPRTRLFISSEVRASAGSNLVVPIGRRVAVEGTASSDAEGEPLSYSWVMTSSPAGTSTVIFGQDTPSAQLTPDRAGSYTLKLTASAGNGLSGAASVTVSANTTPVCSAGTDRLANLQTAVTLSGSASDADDDALSALWTILSGPGGGVLAAQTSWTPAFTPTLAGTYILGLTVSDGRGESASSSVRVTGNSVPQATAVSPARVNTGTAVILDGTSSLDADGDSLSFAWSQLGGPGVTLSSENQAQVVFTPRSSGLYVFRLAVDDGRGGLDIDAVTVEVNSAPSVSAGTSPVFVNVGTPLTLHGWASDLDGDSLAIAWSVVSGPSSGVLTEAATMTPTFIPTAGGWYVLRLTVNDGRGGIVSPEVRVYGNSPPEARAGHASTVTLGSLVTLDGTGSADPDGDPVGYSWSQCPASPVTVTLSNPLSARPFFLLTAPLAHCFVLAASDGRGGVATDTVTVTGNTVPAVSAGAGRTVRVLSSVTLTGTATDADGDWLSYTWSQTGGLGVSLLETHGITVRFSPPVAGSYTFQLAAQDGRGGAASSSVSVLADTPPSVSAGADRVVLVGSTVRLAATASDAEGDALTFAWVRDGGGAPAVALTNADTAYPSFVAGEAGAYRFVVTATDAPGLSSQASVTITANSSPTVSAGPDQTVPLGSPVLLHGSGGDADGDPVTFLWTRTGGTGPAVVLHGADAAVASFVPAEEGVYEFRLQVSDGRGGARADGCAVLVVLPDVSLPPRTTLATASSPGSLLATVTSAGTTFPVLAYDYLLEFEPRFLAAQESQVTLEAQRNFVLTLDRFKSFLDVKLQKSGSPAAVPASALVETRFERLLPGATLPADAVSLLRVGMTARSRRTVLRPTADAGVRQSVVTRLSGGRRTWPGLLAGGASQPHLTLDGRASVDPNRPALPLSYRWEVLADGPLPTTFSAASSPVATFLPSTAGIYRFGLSVSNGVLDAPRSVVEVAVDVANQAPTAVVLAREQAGPARSGPGTQPLIVREGASVELDGRASTDPDAADRFELEYAWVQTAGPSVGTLASQAVVTLAGLTPGVYRFELVARDRAGNASPAGAVGVVAMPRDGQPPSLSLTARAVGVSGAGLDLGTDPAVAGRESLRMLVDTLVTLTAAAEDPEVLDGLQRLTFSWRQLQGPAAAFAQEQAGELASSISFTPPAAGVYEFECYALETDVALRPLGVETSRRIRVVANAPGKPVPRARATLAVAGPGKASVNGHWAGAKVTGVTTAGNVVRLDGSTSTAGSPAFRWTQVDGPAVVLSDPYSAVTTFVAPDLGDGRRRTYSFQLYVEDGTLRSEEAVAVLESVPPGQDPGLASAEATLTLSGGLNLVSVPLQPVGAHPYELTDLLRDTGAQAVFRTAPDAGGRGCFQSWTSSGEGPAPRVGPTDAYLVLMPRGATRRLTLSGTLWDPDEFTRTLSPGLNLIGVPLGFGGPAHVEALRSAAGSGFVAGPHSTPAGLAIHLPGQGTPSRALEPGKGYLVNSPGAVLELRPTAP
jgi:hypothetical protein